ncbi:MAG TPA: hypothetical protein VK638_23990 [Edaphobacter sp.]|nr:hypothetical protein [Edaphobacter sp.]
MSRSSNVNLMDAASSPESELSDIGLKLETIAANAVNSGIPLDSGVLPFAEVFTPLTKLYAAACETAGQEITPVTKEATATEVVMLACALLRAQDLNPFDLALWFSRATHSNNPPR